MKKVKVGINGLGRIGRTVLREIFNRGVDLEVVAVNNPGEINQYIHLLKYDSVHGKFDKKVSLDGDVMHIENKAIKFYNIKDPSEIPWGIHGVEIVIDSTGVFKDKAKLGKHMRDTVKKVIMCAPGKDLDGTFVMGVNHKDYDSTKHHIVSNASCTTNCLAPVAKVLHEKFGIECGLMTTVHSYTLDQQILDAEHDDLRRARAAAVSMIPTTTGAAKAVGLVLPALKGKLDGYAIRVPTPNVSLVDLAVNLKTEATAEQINQALKEASEGELKGILCYEEEELVSVDYMSTRQSSTVDASLTTVMNGKTAKVVAWYDNEMGFSNRVVDLALMMGMKL